MQAHTEEKWPGVEYKLSRTVEERREDPAKRWGVVAEEANLKLLGSHTLKTYFSTTEEGALES